MMHVLTALYPWFKAVYEEGGVPGILWEDYQCDGFATETQKREMRFFKEKLQEAMNTPEAKKAASNVKQPSQEWRKGSKAWKLSRAVNSPDFMRPPLDIAEILGYTSVDHDCLLRGARRENDEVCS